MKDSFDILSTASIPSTKFALRACRVIPALDPGGSGKELVGKGSVTAPAGVATVRFTKEILSKIKSNENYENLRF